MLLRFRRECQLGRTGAPAVKEFEDSKALVVFQNARDCKLAMLFNFADAPTDFGGEMLERDWEKKIDSADLEWLGPGTDLPATIGPSSPPHLRLRPRSFAVFQRTGSES
jgi:hypothetical protein